MHTEHRWCRCMYAWESERASTNAHACVSVYSRERSNSLFFHCARTVIYVANEWILKKKKKKKQQKKHIERHCVLSLSNEHNNYYEFELRYYSFPLKFAQSLTSIDTVAAAATTATTAVAAIAAAIQYIELVAIHRLVHFRCVSSLRRSFLVC